MPGLLFILSLAISSACASEDPDFPLGWAWGGVTHDAATFWVATDEARTVRLVLRDPEDGSERPAKIELLPASDFTGRFRFTRLRPDTAYEFRLWIEGKDGPEPERAKSGRLRTPPPPHRSAPVRFVFGGDLGGQNACRHREDGYPIFRTMLRQRPDFFVGLGDLIYADNPCEAIGLFRYPQLAEKNSPTFDLKGFRAKWRYSRADPHFQAQLRETPFFPIWDDHEVINDFNPRTTGDGPGATPGKPLMHDGLRAFREYHPVPQTGPLYHRIRRGRELELFVLDTRSYRDDQTAPDVNKKSPKTMLGPKQLAWLKRSLAASNARWKIIVSSVPISIPTGQPGARDGWANFDGNTGYENELREIFEYLGRRDIPALWITTDVHFAAVFRYRPLPRRPDFLIHEIVTGPLHAGLFPNKDFDRTFAPERLFFHGPGSAREVRDYNSALYWFNFGLVEVAPEGPLTATIINTRGEELYRLKLERPSE